MHRCTRNRKHSVESVYLTITQEKLDLLKMKKKCKKGFTYNCMKAVLNKAMLLCSTIDWGKSINAIFFDHLVLALHFVRKQ